MRFTHFKLVQPAFASLLFYKKFNTRGISPPTSAPPLINMPPPIPTPPTTGLCSDVARTKGLILRGLAARAPYFQNGAASNLSELLDFYNQRFQMNLTEEEKEQLIAFLNSL
jgi:hypothetical protein